MNTKRKAKGEEKDEGERIKDEVRNFSLLPYPFSLLLYPLSLP